MKRPLQFFILAILITWTFWIPALLSKVDVLDVRFPDWFYLLGGLGPIGAATIMAWLDSKKKGVRKLYASIFIWKVKFYWYLIVLMLPLLMHFIIALSAVFIYELSPDEVSINFSSFLPALIFSAIFMLVEEVGWRGFALPKLQEDNSALTSSLIVGFVWGIWHIPLLFYRPEQFGLALVNSELVTVLIYTANTMALSIVFTWLFNSTRGSLLLATLFHGSSNAVGGTYSIGKDTFANHHWIGLTILLILIGIIIILVTNKDSLSRRNKVFWSHEIPSLKVHQHTTDRIVKQ